MKIYLKSGQFVEMNELHTIEMLGLVYGVGVYYNNNEHDKPIYRTEIYKLCCDNKCNTIEFYYGNEGTFITNTSEVAGIEV